MSAVLEEPMRIRVRSAGDRVVFRVGQRVRVSKSGELSMNLMHNSSRTGVVGEPSGCYPGSITVVRDGARHGLSYHPSYWEPA